MSKALSVLLACGLVVACGSEADPTAPIAVPVFHSSNHSEHGRRAKFVARPNAAEEVMPAGVVNSSRARGRATFTFNRAGDAVTYRLIVTKISNVFQAHIHKAAAGANGPIVVWLYPSTAPGAGPLGQGPIHGVIAEGTITAANLIGPLAGLTLSALLDDLQAGNLYVNVHTNDGVAPTNTGPGDFPGGEIRGQVERLDNGRHHGSHGNRGHRGRD